MSNKFVKQRWKISQKLRFVAESWHLKGEVLGRYLRNKGIHSHDLKIWKEQMAMGIDSEKPVYSEERRHYKSKINRLEKELEEARAIIELQKKVKKLMSEGEEKKPKSESVKESSS